MYRRNKRDGNEPALVTLAEKIGFTWIPVMQSCVDGWAGLGGQWMPVEIKDPKQKGHKNEFKQSQLDFFELCKIRILPYSIWRCDQDVINTRDYLNLMVTGKL